MDIGYNEGAMGLANDLIPLGVMSDTLFEIQINDIVANIARFNGDSGREGLRVAYVHSIPPKLPHPPYRGSEWVIWKSPPKLRLKVNFDGAVFRENDTAGVGAMIQDDKGLMVIVMADMVPLPYSVTAMEVPAAIKAL